MPKARAWRSPSALAWVCASIRPGSSAGAVDDLDTLGPRSADRPDHLAGHVHVDLAEEPFAVEHLCAGDHELGHLVLLCRCRRLNWSAPKVLGLCAVGQPMAQVGINPGRTRLRGRAVVIPLWPPRG
jgi:hypothetical protein